MGREDFRREDARVRGAGVADRDRRDRHAAWHLHRREERIEPARDRVRRHERHADDRKGRERGDRAGEMRRAAGAADDHAHAARLERVDPRAESLRGPVRREHPGLHLDAEGAERLGGESHGGLVRGRAHDDRDARAHATATSCRAMSER